MSVPTVPDTSFFVTDAGVRIGLLTCFDMNYSQPASDLIYNHKVEVIAFPNAWIDELPFLTGKYNFCKIVHF
jgi:predicted amidohydrolase